MSPSKHRVIRAQLGFLFRADGSCALEQGRTVVWCAINGPGDTGSSKRLNEKLHIEVRTIVASAIRQVVDCTRYPRTVLTVALQGLQLDGSEIAANLTSSCLALLDNGIAMNGIFCGVTIASVNGKLIVDPTRKIICNTNAIFTFAVKRSAAGTEVIASDTEGCFEWNSYEAAVKLAYEASSDIFAFFRETFQRKLSVDIWRNINIKF
ncbi:unnamed protein product [Dracunculus medinensis]|uniref:RNase_PH domain-containing protein n=1 Tax=Dracunculus medinensis TaxID=318479 RepID=A0A0N4U6M4_DRAME|nr:unnamed protein product [Dracunculus medinensis]